MDPEKSAKISLPLNPPLELPMGQFQMARPIIIVTTISKDGLPDAALKTNAMIVSSMKRFAFACSSEHQTARNILETKEFVVNLPSEKHVESVLKTAQPYSPQINKLENAGFTAIPSEKVRPPRILECKAHLECVLEWYKKPESLGRSPSELIIFLGKVVAASADEDVLKGNTSERQRHLRQMVLVGSDEYALIGEVKKLPL